MFLTLDSGCRSRAGANLWQRQLSYLTYVAQKSWVTWTAWTEPPGTEHLELNTCPEVPQTEHLDLLRVETRTSRNILVQARPTTIHAVTLRTQAPRTFHSTAVTYISPRSQVPVSASSRPATWVTQHTHTR